MIVSLTAQNTSLMFSVSIREDAFNPEYKTINRLSRKRRILSSNDDQRGNTVTIQHKSRRTTTTKVKRTCTRSEGDVTCSTREMRINYLLRVGIQIYEHSQYEFSGGYGISLGSCKRQTSTGGGRSIRIRVLANYQRVR